MFDMVPFGRRRRRQLSEGEDPFDSLLSDFFSDAMDLADVGFKTDIREDQENYYIESELPGMKKEDINIEIQDDNLVISANREETDETEEENYLRREIRRGSFQRVFRLDNVQEEKIEAEYDNGLLKVTMPKAEPGREEKRVIDIK